VRSAAKETAAEYDNFLFSCMLVVVCFRVYNCFVGVGLRILFVGRRCLDSSIYWWELKRVEVGVWTGVCVFICEFCRCFGAYRR